MHTDERADVIKIFAHLTATLCSWALATVVSTRLIDVVDDHLRLDILSLLLTSIQLAAMLLPYVAYHKDGGPILLTPISCANHYTWLRRVATWTTFTLLAGGMHAWTVLTLPGNPMHSTDAVATAISYVPSACLVVLAGNPVALRDYTTAIVARGTEVEWLVPAAYRHSASALAPRNKVVIRWLMACHLLAALVLMTVPLAGALFRKAWYTKLCACFALSMLVPGCHRRLPIFHLASGLLDAKVMETYDVQQQQPQQPTRGAAAARRGGGHPPRHNEWSNELNVPFQGRELWKAVNRIGVVEHVLLNALMLVTLSVQHHGEIHGPIGWSARAIALGWNVSFASYGGRWWLSQLAAAATRYSGGGGAAPASTSRSRSVIMSKIQEGDQRRGGRRAGSQRRSKSPGRSK